MPKRVVPVRVRPWAPETRSLTGTIAHKSWVAPAMNKPTGPSRIVAAEFLRELARNINVPCGVPEQRAAELRLLADCIENKVAWRRQNELQHTFAESQRYNLAAYEVEHRAPGVSLEAALEAQGRIT